MNAESNHETLGLEFPAGGDHYRAYVGPASDYDLVAAMTFNLLTTLGLRQHHRLLDVGCGSLRVGRLLIPYLNTGHYTGIEPNSWLVAEGIERETGADQIRIKQPAFHYAASTDGLPAGTRYDFAVAQSVFSHCGSDLLKGWLAGLSSRLSARGALVATYQTGESDCEEKGWIYPRCVGYRRVTMCAHAERAGFAFQILDWKHPHQTWALFAKPSFDASWLRGRRLSWNTWMEFGRR
ncbi:MAG: class I SAM-dependent methyltransferase [Lentisphaerae bacterium]|nr:class I SAM-dependent methyltransferase [Lentisphaerota bacterium]